MKVQILKDTPIHRKGTFLTVADFRRHYPTAVVSQDDSNLLQELTNNYEINGWFQAVFEQKEVEIPLEFIMEGLVYRKELDGFYHAYQPGIEFRPENSLLTMMEGEARRRVQEKPFRKAVWYITGYVNKKL